MRLSELELKLVLAPDELDAAFERACILAALARTSEAMHGYHEILRSNPGHFGALNNLGMLLYEVGSVRSALLAYRSLTWRYPDSAIAHTSLAKVLHDTANTEEAILHYRRAIELDPTAASAHHGLANILLERGDKEGADAERRAGFRYRPVTISRFRGGGDPVRLLVLGVDGEGNVPTGQLFDDRVFQVATLIVDFFDPAAPLPPHDVIFNAIGDADRCALALTATSTILARTKAPVLNRPSAVMATGRAANADRLGRLTDVVTARFAMFPRWLLDRSDPVAALSASGFRFPLLLRAPGYHTGEHFVKVDDAAGVQSALSSLPGHAVIAIEFLDTQDSEGKFRKYRVISVDGKPYPLHAAISRDWKVHYFSADMEANEAHRREDAAFLEDPQAVIGERAYRALHDVIATLELDFGGVDFTIGVDGRLIVFEANATMIVQPPSADKRWDYRRGPVERIIHAVQRMLVERAGRSLAGMSVTSNLEGLRNG